ncbi:hypothetical protein [Nocardia brasiliensis]|uniref:hypothetical protein n=1 Tax=Nocardia brasiliensis TaxID=37326 RepID=UPI0024542815|nr:hypothetical protein [Nocardia brasiliensis]
MLLELPELLFHAVRAADVGAAVRLAVTRKVAGPFTIAADPVLDTTRARTEPVWR